MVDNDGVGGRCGVMDARRRSGTAGDKSDHVLSATRRAPARQGHRRRPGDRRDPRRPDARRHPRTPIPQAGERCQRCPTTDVKHTSGDPSTMPKTSHPKYVTCRQKWRLFHGQEYPGEKEALCSFSLPLLILRRLLL